MTPSTVPVKTVRELLREARQEIYLAHSKDGAVYDPTILTRIDAALAATPADVPKPTHVEGEEWQPIETAPKDGTWILVWGEDFDCPMSAQWSLLDINPNSTTFENGWVGYGYIFHDLTHWMPLPQAPTQPQDSVKGEENKKDEQ